MAGDRTILSNDGRSLVIQCGDDEVLQWNAGQSSVTRLGKVNLFSAAQAQGIIPPNVRCPSRVSSSGADCDVIDHTDDWTSYVLKPMSRLDYIVSSKPDVERELPFYSGGGVLLPRGGSADRVVTGQKNSRKVLELRSLSEWTATPLLQLPVRNRGIQDEESGVDEIGYSSTYDLVIVSCGGTFIYFEGDVGFVRAYDLSGAERWSIRRPLPKPERPSTFHAGFTSLHAHVHPFARGRVATVADSSNRSSFDVVTLETGEALGSFSGWPLTASDEANRVLVRTTERDVVLFEFTDRSRP